MLTFTDKLFLFELVDAATSADNRGHAMWQVMKNLEQGIYDEPAVFAAEMADEPPPVDAEPD